MYAEFWSSKTADWKLGVWGGLASSGGPGGSSPSGGIKGGRRPPLTKRSLDLKKAYLYILQISLLPFHHMFTHWPKCPAMSMMKPDFWARSITTPNIYHRQPRRSQIPRKLKDYHMRVPFLRIYPDSLPISCNEQCSHLPRQLIPPQKREINVWPYWPSWPAPSTKCPYQWPEELSCRKLSFFFHLTAMRWQTCTQMDTVYCK